MPRVKLGDVVVANPRVHSAPGGRFVGLDHVVPGDLQLKEWGRVSDGTSFTKRFSAGDVLFARRRSYQRKVALADFSGVCSGDFLVFRAAKDVAPEFVAFVVLSRSFADFAMLHSAGTMSPRAKWSSLREYEFELPSLAEQKRLGAWMVGFNAEYTRAEQAALDAAASLESFELRLAEHRIAALGGEPCVELGAITKWRSGGTPPVKRSELYGGSIPFVRTGDLNDDVIGETPTSLSEPGVVWFGDLVPARSVLCAMYGATIGKTGINLGVVAANQAVVWAEPSANHRPRYLQIALLALRRKLLSSAGGSAQPNINKTIVLQSEVPLPNLVEQDAVIERFDYEVAKLRELLEALNAHKRSLAEMRDGVIETVVGRVR